MQRYFDAARHHERDPQACASPQLQTEQMRLQGSAPGGAPLQAIDTVETRVDSAGTQQGLLRPEEAGLRPAQHPLPPREECLRLFERMLLIRRFEERAGEMYARAKIGGFLHLCIGEEATVVGTCEAMRPGDYLLSTYREHGQALARGTSARAVMAELFGKEAGCSRGRGGSMHLYDGPRRFLGGYGIVGANLPIGAGVALACALRGSDDAVVTMFGDGATNQGTFGETMNLAALWRLPVVFVVVNNQFGMGTRIDRHSAVLDLSRKSEGFGVPGRRCDGMDVLDVRRAIGEALRLAREERRPQLVEAVTYRFRGHSMADPEVYRVPEEVAEWRRRDPLATFPQRILDEGVATRSDLEAIEARVHEVVEDAVQFADAAPFPAPETLYDHVYVYGGDVPGWWTVDERSPDVYRGERAREASERARQLAEQAAQHQEEAGHVGRTRRDLPDELAPSPPPPLAPDVANTAAADTGGSAERPADTASDRADETHQP
ncbi:MAG: pyruvate dehydrogenase (acetyl-transferring) E1 component subunit alpha [Thermoleophilum sp.]|nr:pyruvate dehydrogenase (acetyl-transferring) E1 component subunit alpha [Thermoleophilum sp.]